MDNLLRWTARGAGVVGILLCAASVVLRAGNTWWIGGLQVGTVLQGGMAAMILACLAYLAALVEGARH